LKLRLPRLGWFMFMKEPVRRAQAVERELSRHRRSPA